MEANGITVEFLCGPVGDYRMAVEGMKSESNPGHDELAALAKELGFE